MPVAGAGSAERIYSVAQLSEALQAGVMGLKDQLQVLSILDGSATCWPGVSAAHADLDALVKLAGQHLADLEQQNKQLATSNTRLQEQNSQLASKLRATSAAKQRAQDELQEQGQAYKQAKLEAAQASAQQAQQQRWEVEKATAQLAQQATKHTQEVEFLEGEVAGLRQHELHLREQVAVQQEQLASARQELAIKAAELSHMTSALQEHKDSIAHTRSQLASVQDNLGGQLRALQSGTQAEKLQSDREIGRLTQEVSNLAATLSKAEAEVSRLKEWQDVFKRMADDKAQEAVQELNACKAHAAERQAAARGEAATLQERLISREAQVGSLQQELSLLQLHVREAQRAQGAAAEAQAAAGTALDQQEAELAALQQELKNAHIAIERARADHLAAESEARQAATAAREQLALQLEQAQREVAVKQALCEGWQRANQALQDKAKQLDAAAAAAVATADSSMSDLRIQLEAERAEARRAKMESSSLIKQYEQLVQRLRREADASAEEVCRLRSLPQQSAICSDDRLDAAAGADVSQHIQHELVQLHRAMHTISGNLEAAEATMQQLTAAQAAGGCSAPTQVLPQGAQEQPGPPAGNAAAAAAAAEEDARVSCGPQNTTLPLPKPDKVQPSQQAGSSIVQASAVKAFAGGRPGAAVAAAKGKATPRQQQQQGARHAR